MLPKRRKLLGFTLVELLVALAISALLIIAMLRIVEASTRGFRTQQALSRLLGDSQFAIRLMSEEIMAAGYTPTPWQAAMPALTNSNSDGGLAPRDRLSLQRWSTNNCHGSPNPVTGSAGLPKMYLLINEFGLNSRNELVQRCRYGPDAGSLVVQMNQLGLMENVEALQFEFAEDTDLDGYMDRWVLPGAWQNEQGIKAVRISLLVASPEPVGKEQQETHLVAGIELTPPADGRLRDTREVIVSIRGRER